MTHLDRTRQWFEEVRIPSAVACLPPGVQAIEDYCMQINFVDEREDLQIGKMSHPICLSSHCNGVVRSHNYHDFPNSM